MLVSTVFLGLAVAAAGMVAWLTQDAGDAGPGREAAAADRVVIGGSAWEGLRAAFRSPYLLGISGYVLMMTVIATFIYFTRLQMVAAQTDDTDTRTALFANIDMITQVVTLLLQLVVTGQLMKRLGVSVSLAMLPVAVSLGFIGLAMVASFAALILFDATFRAIQRAITRPARETLFTVVTREDKYKSKAFTDTFVYRGGDVLGAWTEGLLGRLGMALVGLASVAVPLALGWGLLGLWLGRRQGTLAASFGSARAETSASERAGAALGGQPRPAIR
jgi:AAA family ATP:ADP antiporter